MTHEGDDVDLEAFSHFQETCYLAAKTFANTKVYYQNIASKVVTLPLSKYFRTPELATAFVPFYLDKTLKFLIDAGVTAAVVTQDGIRQVNFLFDSNVVAVFDPTEEPVVATRDLERDFIKLKKLLKKPKRASKNSSK